MNEHVGHKKDPITIGHLVLRIGPAEKDQEILYSMHYSDERLMVVLIIIIIIIKAFI